MSGPVESPASEGRPGRSPQPTVARPRTANAALLFPGPQPPLTHLGATLLRHVVAAGLRYALYHLGQPVPEKPPLRIERLRLFFDPAPLERTLGADGAGEDGGEGRTPSSGEVVLGALLEPGGDGGRPGARLRGTLAFHRLRARIRPPTARIPGVSRREEERLFADRLREAAPALRDALLVEVMEAIGRRALRGRGREVPPVLSPAARSFAAGDERALVRLGPPDPFTASWAAAGAPAAVATAPIDPAGVARDRRCRRGLFREVYRQVLDGLRPALLVLGEDAAARGVLERPDDVFFLPIELLGSLDGDARPSWLDHSVLRNRAEYFQLVRSADRAEERAWARAPLAPMP